MIVNPETIVMNYHFNKYTEARMAATALDIIDFVLDVWLYNYVNGDDFPNISTTIFRILCLGAFLNLLQIINVLLLVVELRHFHTGVFFCVCHLSCRFPAYVIQHLYVILWKCQNSYVC